MFAVVSEDGLEPKEWQRKAANEAGSALVELALTLPVLFILIIGAAEFGRLMYAAIEISNAARSGAAYGAQTLITAEDSAGIASAAIRDSADISMSATPVVALSCACSDMPSADIVCSTALTTCASPHRVIEYVQVTTSGTISPTIRLPGLPQAYTLSGNATMQVAR